MSLIFNGDPEKPNVPFPKFLGAGGRGNEHLISEIRVAYVSEEFGKGQI